MVVARCAGAAAQRVGLVAEDDIGAAVCCSDGGHQPTDAATDNEDIAFFYFWFDVDHCKNLPFTLRC